MPRANATSKLRVLLADDHLVVREGLKALINREGDMEVVGEVGDGRDVCQAAEKLRPHVVVMDVSMPHVNGMEATRQLKQALPDIRVVALSVHEDRVYIRRILEAGAAGYVPKRAVAAELLRAVRVVAGGALYVDPQVASQARGLLTGSSARVSAGAASELSPGRQRFSSSSPGASPTRRSLPSWGSQSRRSRPTRLERWRSWASTAGRRSFGWRSRKDGCGRARSTRQGIS